MALAGGHTASARLIFQALALLFLVLKADLEQDERLWLHQPRHHVTTEWHCTHYPPSWALLGWGREPACAPPAEQSSRGQTVAGPGRRKSRQGLL